MTIGHGVVYAYFKLYGNAAYRRVGHRRLLVRVVSDKAAGKGVCFAFKTR